MYLDGVGQPDAGWRRATARFVVAVSLAAGCSHAWDDLDPRLGASTTTTGATTGSTTASSSASTTSTSSTGEGGATTASSSSSSGATGGGGAATTASTGSGGSTGAGGSGGQAPTCAANGTSTFTDAFEGAAIDAQWNTFENAPATLAQTGGELVVSLGSSVGGSFFTGVSSKDPFDLIGCHLLVEATAVPDPSTDALGALQIIIDGDDYLELLVGNGLLAFKVWTAGALSFYADLPYDALAHRWWRMREENGFILYETSSDGAAWTLRSSVANTHDVTSVYIGLVAGMYLPEPVAPGEMKFDNLNLAP